MQIFNFFGFSLDKVSKSVLSTEIIMTEKIMNGGRKSMVFDMAQREYDDKTVISGKEVAGYIKCAFEKIDIYFTDMNMSDEEWNSLKVINILVGGIADYVYQNISLLAHLFKLYNANGAKKLTDICELEWDFEHRCNLAISDVYESLECIYYRLIVDSLKN